MSKVGGRRNFGYGKTLAWAGKNALRDRYGAGHFATQAAHAARWAKFAKFAKASGVRDARKVTRELVELFASTLAGNVERQAMAVRYAQNLVSTVNVVLETLRGDRALHVSPATLVGRRLDVRERPPIGMDRNIVQAHIANLERKGEFRVAAIAHLARELGLRFREASLLNARTAYREAIGCEKITVRRGTKGARGKAVPRQVPVSQRGLAALKRAAACQGAKENLLPSGMSFRQWRDHAYGEWNRAADTLPVFGFHDLRAAYACERYEALTGAPAPVIAGRRSAAREADRAARRVIAEELGHGRIEIVSAYVGSAR